MAGCEYGKMQNLVKYIALFMINYLVSCNGLAYNYVTCGSVLKLLNVNYKVRLHSHEVKYGSGSGQQSVTAIEGQDDVNSHWMIYGKIDHDCTRGEPVACGSVIRLKHITTDRYLHSHLFSSPLSSAQEVSAFGEGGKGDTGDHWTVVCEGDSWRRDNEIMIRHQDTNKYLVTTGQVYGRPISGQMEVAAVSHADYSAQWRASEGVFIKPSETITEHIRHDPSEL